MAYNLAIWACAIVSVWVMVVSRIFGFSPFYGLSGIQAGAIWAYMVIGYHDGYARTRLYMAPRKVPVHRVVLNGVWGSLVDAVAPWYAVFSRRPKGFQVIRKDRATPSSSPRPPLSVPVISATMAEIVIK